MIPLGRQTVTLVRREVVDQDGFGNDIHATVRLSIDGCSVQPRASVEDGAGRAQVISGVVLYAPAHTPIGASDVVEHDGRRYEVVGDPGVWRSPIGLFDHQQVALRRVTG